MEKQTEGKEKMTDSQSQWTFSSDMVLDLLKSEQPDSTAKPESELGSMDFTTKPDTEFTSLDFTVQIDPEHESTIPKANLDPEHESGISMPNLELEHDLKAPLPNLEPGHDPGVSISNLGLERDPKTSMANLEPEHETITPTAGLEPEHRSMDWAARIGKEYEAMDAASKPEIEVKPQTVTEKAAQTESGSKLNLQAEPKLRSGTSRASEKTPAEIQGAAQLILKELKKVIVGKDEILKKVLMVIFAGGHILLEDVPGVGKTTLALGLSKVLNLDYRRMQFTPDTMASDIMGFSIYNKETGGLDYKPGAALCNLFLADEINRTSAKTQAALLEVMEEGGMTVDGITHKTPEPFICIATQNPMGTAGTQKLPDSQLDRFMVRLSMGYPDLQSQVNIVKQRQIKDPMETVRPLASASHIKTMKHGVQMVQMGDEIIEYAAALCQRTRSMEEVEQGVSPRAVLALVQMAKAAALMDGRDYAIPQDVKEVFIDVCAHRLILTARAKIRKETEQKVLQKILKEIKPPAILEGKASNAKK